MARAARSLLGYGERSAEASHERSREVIGRVRAGIGCMSASFFRLATGCQSSAGAFGQLNRMDWGDRSALSCRSLPAVGYPGGCGGGRSRSHRLRSARAPGRLSRSRHSSMRCLRRTGHWPPERCSGLTAERASHCELKSKVLAEAGPATVASASATATTPRIRRKRMVRVIERPPVGWIAGAIRVASSLWEDGDALVTFVLPVLSQLRDRLGARIIACHGGRIPGVAAVSDAWSA